MRERNVTPFQEKLNRVIFEADTPAGKRFDVWLMIMILASVLTVFLESIASLRVEYSQLFFGLEWIFTIFFTVEYIIRIYCALRPIVYVRSFYGIIDLLSIFPTYLSLLIPGSQVGAAIRVLRLLRVFRIFKLEGFLHHGDVITTALVRSRRKITLFLYVVLLMVVVIGSLMYLIESYGPAADKFSSIPRSIYWAIVTITTVGYGDISPATTLGQLLAALVMIAGYAIIAVPTGIVSAEFMRANTGNGTKLCPHCQREGHDQDADHCKYCGSSLGAHVTDNA